MSLEIFEMIPTDFYEALALWRVTPGVGINDADTPEAFRAFLARNPCLSMMARLNGEVIGTVLCGHDGRRGYLYHLAVAEQYRYCGIARILVENSLARLAACGIRKCHIFVYAQNTGGEAFWRHTGWVERTELKIMSKDLVPPGKDDS